jgi:hypothetical protein
MHSAVAISCNQGMTRIVLADRVEGEPRLLGTVAVPGRDVETGLAFAEERFGRRLLAEERPIRPRGLLGDGADAWIAVGSPASVPLLAVLAIAPDPLLTDLAKRAAEAAMVETHWIDATQVASLTALVQQLVELRPRFLLLTGGSDESAWQSAMVAVSNALGDAFDLEVGIVIAPEAIQQLVAKTIGDQVELMGVDPTTYQPAEVVRAVTSEFRSRVATLLSAELKALELDRFVDRATALERALAFLVRRADQRVALVDLEQGMLGIWARSEGMLTLYRAGRDLEQGALGLAALGPETIARWLPFPMTEEDILDWLANRVMTASPFLFEWRDQLIATAAVRALVQDLASAGPPSGMREDLTLVVLGPRLAWLPAELALLCALDGFAPLPAGGLVSVALDEADLLATCGALAEIDPGYAATLLERDALFPLAHVIVVAGDAMEGAIAVRGEVRAGDLVHRFAVPWGSLHVLPFPSGRSAELLVEPEAGVRIGSLEPGVAIEFAGEAALGWTRLGIVIDARGRPLRLPDDPPVRARRIRSWLADLGVAEGVMR